MSSLGPGPEHIGPSQHAEADSRILSIETDDVATVFDCLTSATARQLFATLHENPQTASELAETAETSIQNVKYHLGKFQNAELIVVVDHRTSARGMAMDVYAPKDGALVLYVGHRDPEDHAIRDLLRGVLSAVGVLAALSLVLEAVLPMVLSPVVPGDTTPGDGSAGGTEPIVLDIGLLSVSPGLVFFAGGMLGLVVVTWLAIRRSDSRPLGWLGGS